MLPAVVNAQAEELMRVKGYNGNLSAYISELIRRDGEKNLPPGYTLATIERQDETPAPANQSRNGRSATS